MLKRDSLPARLRTRIQLVSDRLDQISKAVCVVLILFMALEVITAVFFRYVLFAPLRWGEELARLVMIWIGMLGIAIALKDGEHIGIETVVSHLSKRQRAWCNLLSYLFISIFLVLLFYFGLLQAIRAWNIILPALLIPWTWPMLAVPCAAVVQLVHLIPMILDEIDV
ncbi:MAG: TRAP transporter small permease, partial [Deltaproteobacteria bacterium]